VKCLACEDRFDGEGSEDKAREFRGILLNLKPEADADYFGGCYRSYFRRANCLPENQEYRSFHS